MNVLPFSFMEYEFSFLTVMHRSVISGFLSTQNEFSLINLERFFIRQITTFQTPTQNRF